MPIFTGTPESDLIAGSRANDRIYGLEGGDILSGDLGNDLIEGGEGADTMDGGAGIDTLYYRSSPIGVTVNLVTGLATGGHGQGDRFINFENVYGSDFGNDTILGDTRSNALFGGGGADRINGGAGNDRIEGGTGSDVMNGAAGLDTLSYLSSSAGVTVDLLTGAAAGGDATGDRFADFENIQGSQQNDVLSGNSAINSIFGLGGNDIVQGRGAGDVLDGGGGIDTLDYRSSSGAVQISLWNGMAAGGDATGDMIANFENVIGSNAAADTIFGDDNGNTLIGLGGNDYLSGLGGNDLIEGGAGADNMEGGSGIDTLSYAGSGNGVNVDLTTGDGFWGDAAGDTFFGLENVIGSNGADFVFGDAAANAVWGNNGNDSIFTQGGNDSIDAGAGDDFVGGGDGADSMSGGDGNDTLFYVDSSAGVHVFLGNGNASGGAAEGDRFSGFENVWGSYFDDILFGGDGVNTINGDQGNDFIDAGLGDDTITGNSGDDTLIGGRGADTFIFDTSSGINSIRNDVLLDYTPGTDRIVIRAVTPLDLSQVNLTASGNGTMMTIGSGSSGSVYFAAVSVGSMMSHLSDFIFE